MDEPSDEELARFAGQGDLAAFEVLLKRHSGPLLLFCTHVLRDRAAAEDAVQETFLRVHVHLPRFDLSKRFASCITAIAHNLCRDMLRARGRETPVEGLESVAAERPDDDAIESRLGGLPAKHRAILFQKYRLGLNATKIAERLGLSSADVRSSLHRTLKVLRGSLVR